MEWVLLLLFTAFYDSFLRSKRLCYKSGCTYSFLGLKQGGTESHLGDLDHVKAGKQAFVWPSLSLWLALTTFNHIILTHPMDPIQSPCSQ